VRRARAFGYVWLCGTDIRSGPGFLLRDPNCDRFVFDPPPFEKVFDTTGPDAYLKLNSFKSAYIRRVIETASQLTSGDMLCLVICGHGLPDGRVVVGDAEAKTLLVKSNLEDAVRSCKAEVHLLITACYGGRWTSPYWSLFAAVASHQQPISITESHSGNFRGGVFTMCLLAEHADQHSLRVPKPDLWRLEENDGVHHYFQGQQAGHGLDLRYFGQYLPTHRRLGRAPPEALTWLHELSDHVEKTYPSAEFTFVPCQQGTAWRPSFVDMTKLPSIQHCECRGSRSNSNVNNSGKAQDSLLGSFQADSVDVPLLSNEDKELHQLAEDHNTFLPPPSLSETMLAINCAALLDPDHQPRKRLTAKAKDRMLKSLQLRLTYRCLSLVIAQKLGWEKAIEDVGLPFETQRQLGPDIPLQLRAIENGYALDMLYSHKYNSAPWVGGGSWLARVWKAAGEPTIRRSDWEIVLTESCEEVGLEPSELLLQYD
jgi:hypothetical protein